MQEFLNDLFADAVTPDCRIAVFTTPDRQIRFFSDTSELTDYASRKSAVSDVYFGLGLIQGTPAGRGKCEDVAGIGALWADIDLERDGKRLPASIDEADWILRQLPLPPSIIVHSGHGLHAYWLLHEPWIFQGDQDRDSASRLSKAWHGKVCATAAKRDWRLENLGDLTRVLRLPGTINHKGKPAEVRAIESVPTRRYDPEDFWEFLPTTVDHVSLDVADIVLQPDAEPPAEKMLAAGVESPQFWATWNRARDDLDDTSQSGYDLSLATIAALRGWNEQEIANLIIAARRKHQANPDKALRPDYIKRTLARALQATDVEDDVNLSGFVEEDEPALEDPGPIPEDLFAVPGFVADVMDFTLKNAPYPNIGLAFCGAVALQSFLAGRKVCTSGDLRTNLYLLALASSGTGKEFPRKVNAHVLYEVGMIQSLGDKFASGEGIQDALSQSGMMLFQNDEMDGVLRQINLDQDNRRESIPNILLTLYTSASDVYPIRAKAGQKERIHVDQPHLTLFGTATPQHFYESLSKRMLTNGFFARLGIVDVGRRGVGQTPGSARDVPSSVIEVARWWAEFNPGQGNLRAFHPEPVFVPIAPDAQQAITKLQRLSESEYTAADQLNDEVARTAWSRTCEQAQKLALVYACSEDHECPRIKLEAVEWATEFAMHQTRRQLYLAATYVAENPFHASCLKVKRLIHEAGGTESRRELMRAMHCKAADFDQIVSTMYQQGQIVPVVIPTRTKPKQGYQLA